MVGICWVTMTMTMIKIMMTMTDDNDDDDDDDDVKISEDLPPLRFPLRARALSCQVLR